MQGAASIFRFNPTRDEKPYYRKYPFTFHAGMTALDVLNQIREEQDPTLAYSHCCRNGHCGLCGIVVNKKPVLSCKQAASAEMTLEPLCNLPVLRDLIIDREAYERNRPQLRLFLERHGAPAMEPETVDMERFEAFKVASRCIECFCCVSACPEYAKNPHRFAGPAAFALEARHYFDPRDALNRDLVARGEGLEHCTDCGLCSRVCGPKADPAGSIRKMKEAVTAGRDPRSS